MSTSQGAGLRRPTGKGIQGYCKKHSLNHSFIEIPSEGNLDLPPAILHVIELDKIEGSRSLLYFHGGGYANYISPGAQIPLALEMAHSSRSRFLVILEYSIAPEVPYPGQTVQAISALRILCTPKADIPPNVLISGDGALALISESKPAAENLILAGVSAGGHLVLSVLAHIKKPSPYCPTLTLRSPLKAALMLSPWTSTKYDAPSYFYNADKDFLLKARMEHFHEAWKPKSDEVYADLLNAAPSLKFWKEVLNGADRLAERSLITIGTDEVFLDDVTALADATDAKEKGSQVQFVLCRGEAHVGLVMDIITGTKNGNMRTAIAGFLKQM